MNRWHARLAELHAAIRFPDGVQNVQNVQNALAGAAFEQFEHSEQRPDDCKERPHTGQERAVVEWPNHHSPRAGQTVERSSAPFAKTLAALEHRHPDYVEANGWRQAVEDGRAFLSRWGEQAEALGWTAKDLFGLHEPPEKPHPSYRRLSRYDQTGLIWLLAGRPVVALTATTAAIDKELDRRDQRLPQAQQAGARLSFNISSPTGSASKIFCSNRKRGNKNYPLNGRGVTGYATWTRHDEE